MAKKRRRATDLDIVAEGQSLYRAALARQDFNGAAACLRLLRDLVQATPVDPRVRDRAAIVGEMTPVEREEATRIMGEMRALVDVVRRRLGLKPRDVGPVVAPASPPAPSIEAPPPSPPPPPRPDPGDEMVEVIGSRGPRVVSRRDLDAAHVLMPKEGR